MKYIFAYLIIINIVLFFMMAWDKNRAKNAAWRVRESTLFVLAAIGGSIGGIIAMQAFRHKTKNKSFTIGFPFILIMQIILAIAIIFLIGQ